MRYAGNDGKLRLILWCLNEFVRCAGIHLLSQGVGLYRAIRRVVGLVFIERADMLELVEKLNKLVDAATKYVVEREEVLAKAGVCARVIVKGSNPAIKLGCERVGDEFRIVVVRSCDVVPWSDCSREEKLISVEWLFQLEREIDTKLFILLEKAERIVGRIAQELV